MYPRGITKCSATISESTHGEISIHQFRSIKHVITYCNMGGYKILATATIECLAWISAWSNMTYYLQSGCTSNASEILSANASTHHRINTSIHNFTLKKLTQRVKTKIYSQITYSFHAPKELSPAKKQTGDDAFWSHERYPREQLFNAQDDNSKENQMNPSNPEVDQKPEIEAESN